LLFAFLPARVPSSQQCSPTVRRTDGLGVSPATLHKFTTHLQEGIALIYTQFPHNIR
jgi:hypothetical protein